MRFGALMPPNLPLQKSNLKPGIYEVVVEKYE